MPKQRGKGEGGLYFVKQQNLWRGVVDVGYWPDGRRRQKSVTSRTKMGAREKLRALQAEIAEYGAPVDQNMTVAVWAKHWLETVCRPTMKPQPFSQYASVVRTWIIPTIGHKRIAQLRPSDLRAVTLAITNAGRSQSTAIKAHTVLSSMLESARLDGAVRRNVARDVVPPKSAIKERGALPTADALALLQQAALTVDGTRWWFAILTGMRQGERLGATLDSIDFDKGRFTVRWSLTEARFEHGCADPATCRVKRAGSCPDRRMILAPGLEHRTLEGAHILVTPKSGRPRTFPMIPQLAVALRRYLEATAHVPNPHGLIWRNPDGSPITAKQDADAWRALLLDAGLITSAQALAPKDRPEGTPDVPTTHWARHTTATVLMELGVPVKVIGEIVGHTSQRITDHYSHVSTEEAQKAMNAIGTHFAGALGSGVSGEGLLPIGQ